MFYIALIYLDFEIVYSAMWIYNELTKKGGGGKRFLYILYLIRNNMYNNYTI